MSGGLFPADRDYSDSYSSALLLSTDNEPSISLSITTSRFKVETQDVVALLESLKLATLYSDLHWALKNDKASWSRPPRIEALR